jgi:uncharacterized membrane protein
VRLILILQYPLVNHLGAYLERGEIRLASLAWVVLGFFWSGLLTFSPRAIAGLIGVWAGLLGLYHYEQIGWLYLLLPGIVPLALLVVFAMTLRPGSEALVTRIGEQARGPLSEEMRHYTNRLTLLWCVVFGVLAVQAIVLFMLRGLGQQEEVTESVLVNIVTPLVVTGLFVGEFFIRKKRFPDHDHPGFFDYLAIVRTHR